MDRNTANQGSIIDEQAIGAIHQRMIDAWNAGDADAFAAPFLDDADFVAFEGTRLKGRAEITAFHRKIFDTAVKGTRLEGEVRFVRLLSDALAVLHSTVRVTLQGRAEPSPSRDSMQLTLVVKQHGQWRCAALLNARRLTLERQFFLDGIDSLPPEAQRRLADFVSSLQKQR